VQDELIGLVLRIEPDSRADIDVAKAAEVESAIKGIIGHELKQIGVGIHGRRKTIHQRDFQEPGQGCMTVYDQLAVIRARLISVNIKNQRRRGVLDEMAKDGKGISVGAFPGLSWVELG
jgi:hypothetical protein